MTGKDVKMLVLLPIEYFMQDNVVVDKTCGSKALRNMHLRDIWIYIDL